MMSEEEEQGGCDDDASYTTVASYDVGQTYLASCIVRIDTESSRGCVIHWAIDHFTPGMPKKKLSEIHTAAACAEVVRLHVETFAVRRVIIENQLTAARRNCVVESAVIAVAVALYVPYSVVHPALKMQFMDPALQLLVAAKKTHTTNTSSRGLKQMALEIVDTLDCPETFGRVSDVANRRLRLDYDTFSAMKKSAYTTTHTWYHKDLADAFLQLVNTVNMVTMQ